MRRADRLFRIVQHLRGRRLTTAAFLADKLGVSLRTVYRDVRDLSLSGVPVEGEAGVGYRLKAGFDVPPLMFALNEIEALAVGARMVEAWGGPVLADSARTAIEKIVAALPADRRLAVEQTRLYAPGFHVDGKASARGVAARAVLLGRHLDARRLVREPHRFPQFPRRPHRRPRGAHAPLSGPGRPPAGGFPAGDAAAQIGSGAGTETRTQISIGD